MPKTCKSNEKAHGIVDEIGVLAQRWIQQGNGFPSSGKRVSNTWVTCLIDRDTVWKRTLIPDVIYGLKGAFKASLRDGPASH